MNHNKQPVDVSSTHTLINIDDIIELPKSYPSEFIQFCLKHELKPPRETCNSGIALLVMLEYRHNYWDRSTCEEFVTKFNIDTDDAIQLFNKFEQKGFRTNKEKGKYYIVYPYNLSTKYKMRKNFKFDGTSEDKEIEINKIKSTIKTDYCDVPNNLWQIGHKNPGSIDNTSTNLVLQPPIQSKYRDNYIFIDTLTKFPTPSKLKSMISKKEIEITHEQICEFASLFNDLATSI